MSSSRGKGRRKFTVDSLFQDTSARAAGVRDLIDAKEIEVDRISPDPDQPRTTFDPESLEELAASIAREGVLQPIAVRYDEERDRYIILHGERRWRACQLAGVNVVPAIVRDVPEERRIVHQLMENVVREDLNAVDRAAALRHLKRQMNNAPWESVAEVVGIRRSRLFQLLSTEKLAESVQDRIRNGQLSEKQTRSLQGLSPDAQEVLAEMLVGGLNERSLRDISRRLRRDTDYLELDQGQLHERIDSLRLLSTDDEPAPGADPVSAALRELFDSPDLPGDANEALETVRKQLSSSSTDDADELYRVGIQLARLASSGRGAEVPSRKLRALRRLIDLAIASQRQ